MDLARAYFGSRRNVGLQRTTHWVTVISHVKESAMNRDQVKGRVNEVKGKVKEATGKVLGNKELELKGKVQNATGNVQAAVGDLKSDIKKST